jgi:hypothetical protein
MRYVLYSIIILVTAISVAIIVILINEPQALAAFGSLNRTNNVVISLYGIGSILFMPFFI